MRRGRFRVNAKAALGRQINSVGMRRIQMTGHSASLFLSIDYNDNSNTVDRFESQWLPVERVKLTFV